MLTTEISRAALELPPEDRLELARRLVESVVEPAALADAVKESSAASRTLRPDASPA